MSFSNKVFLTYSVSRRISFLIDLIAYKDLSCCNSARKTLPNVPRPSTIRILKSSKLTLTGLLIDYLTSSILSNSSLSSMLTCFESFFIIFGSWIGLFSIAGSGCNSGSGSYLSSSSPFPEFLVSSPPPKPPGSSLIS